MIHGRREREGEKVLPENSPVESSTFEKVNKSSEHQSSRFLTFTISQIALHKDNAQRNSLWELPCSLFIAICGSRECIVHGVLYTYITRYALRSSFAKRGERTSFSFQVHRESLARSMRRCLGFRLKLGQVEVPCVLVAFSVQSVYSLFTFAWHFFSDQTQIRNFTVLIIHFFFTEKGNFLPTKKN